MLLEVLGTKWVRMVDGEQLTSIAECSIDDLKSIGGQFTGSNKQDEGSFITSTIDRVLVNEAWMRILP